MASQVEEWMSGSLKRIFTGVPSINGLVMRGIRVSENSIILSLLCRWV